MKEIKVKLKGKLRKEKEIADMVCLIVLQVKEEFKNLSLDSHRGNNDLLMYIMNHVEERSADLSKATVKSLDKNDLVLSIYKELYGRDATEQEIAAINDNIEFIITNKLVKVSNWVVRKGTRCCSFFSSILNGR
jgi:hypothetical protein